MYGFLDMSTGLLGQLKHYPFTVESVSGVEKKNTSKSVADIVSTQLKRDT